MAINKVIYGGNVLIDLTADTVGHGSTIIPQGITCPNTTIGIIEMIVVWVEVALFPS